MTEVAPVRHQETLGSVAAARVGVAGDVLVAVRDAWKQTVPGRGARTHHEVEVVLGEALHPLVVVLRLVPPVEHHEVAIDLRDALGMGVDDVAPDHRPLAVAAREIADPPHVAQVDAPGTELSGAFCRGAALEVVGLVAVRVEALGPEVRQEFVEQVCEELIGPGQRR